LIWSHTDSGKFVPRSKAVDPTSVGPAPTKEIIGSGPTEVGPTRRTPGAGTFRNPYQWNLSDIALAIAGLAVSFALFGVERTAVGFVLLAPLALARPTWPLTISAWAVVIGPPALLVMAHHVNMLNTFELRALPAVVELAGAGICWSLPLSIAIAWVRILRFWRRGLPIWLGARPVFALLLVWSVLLLIQVCGPREVAEWFTD
jgi:hypothetical protein